MSQDVKKSNTLTMDEVHKKSSSTARWPIEVRREFFQLLKITEI